MSNIRNIISRIKTWANTGTSNQILIRKILVVCLALLMLYGIGYAVGTFLAHIG